MLLGCLLCGRGMVSFGTIDDRVQRSASAYRSPTVGTTPVTPVAVIGMAGRLPRGIDSPERLWEALLGGDDLIAEIPPDRWHADEYYDPSPGCRVGRCKRGVFLDDVAGFDSEFFGINGCEAIALDPQLSLAAGNLLGSYVARLLQRSPRSGKSRLDGLCVYERRKLTLECLGRTAAPALRHGLRHRTGEDVLFPDFHSVEDGPRNGLRRGLRYVKGSRHLRVNRAGQDRMQPAPC
jgi:hypothetical protein